MRSAVPLPCFLNIVKLQKVAGRRPQQGIKFIRPPIHPSVQWSPYNHFAWRIKKNQSPKGIMRSAVPLPCFSDVVKSQRVVGQRLRQGTKSCRIGRNSVRPSVRPSVPPLASPQTLLAGPQTPPAGPQTLLAGPQTLPASPQTPPAGPQTPPAGP